MSLSRSHSGSTPTDEPPKSDELRNLDEDNNGTNGQSDGRQQAQDEDATDVGPTSNGKVHRWIHLRGRAYEKDGEP